MSLDNNKYRQKKINKYLHEKMSEGSLDTMWNYHELYEGLRFCLQEVFKWNEKKIEGRIRVASMIDGWLNKAKAVELCQEYKDKNIDLIYTTFRVFDYSNECLDVLNLLSKDGAALFFTPAMDYKKIYQYIETSDEFHISAVFGSYDERDTINPTDKEYVTPLRCKYIAVLITRQKKDLLYLWPEFSIFHGEHQDLIDDAYESSEYLAKDLKKFFDKKLSLSDNAEVYSRIISANRVVVKLNKFYDVESFYTNAKISQSKKWFPEFPKKKLGNIVKNLATNPIAIVNFFKCVDNDGELDIDKWNLYATEGRATPEHPNESFSELFDIIDESYEAKEYTPGRKLKNMEQIYIVETYNDEFTSPCIKTIHPFDWHMGEIKSSSWEGGVFFSSLAVLDPNVIIGKYLVSFLESEAGLLSMTKALAHSDDYSKAWQEIEIPLPDIGKQKIIASAMSNANSLEDELSILKEQLIKNPNKASEIDDSLKDWLGRLDKLSIDEKIIKLVKNGETEAVEFKETLSLDIKKQTKQKYIEHSSLKTIAGFLNSKGGVLLVGVSDDGSCPGIFAEVEKFHKDKLNKANFDKFLLHFKNLIKRSVGEEFYPYIEYQLVDVNESKMLYVNCGKSEKPCYLDGKDFYVRTNPATDKLEGPKLVDYIQNHFS